MGRISTRSTATWKSPPTRLTTPAPLSTKRSTQIRPRRLATHSNRLSIPTIPATPRAAQALQDPRRRARQWRRPETPDFPTISPRVRPMPSRRAMLPTGIRTPAPRGSPERHQPPRHMTAMECTGLDRRDTARPMLPTPDIPARHPRPRMRARRTRSIRMPPRPVQPRGTADTARQGITPHTALFPDANHMPASSSPSP